MRAWPDNACFLLAMMVGNELVCVLGKLSVLAAVAKAPAAVLAARIQ